MGKYLRELYDGFINRLYLPDEITIRTTDYARTQMTALTALSALYPPPPAQKWNPNLDWQPIPYNTPPYDEDDVSISRLEKELFTNLLNYQVNTFDNIFKHYFGNKF